MKNKFKTILAVSLGICIVVFALTGCAQLNRDQQDPGVPERNVPGENMGTRPEGGNLLGGDRDAPGQGVSPSPDANRNLTGIGNQTPQAQTGFDRERAERLTEQLDNVEGIREINVIVNDNTAIVVYTPNERDKDSEETDTMIVNRVKEIDNTITRVEVSSSPDIMTRADQLADGVANNRPMQELNNMFDQLLQTITPRR
ncbi:UNVERIFIED_CONTAM: YhcN/YlaJ family sporulation lipoprotein [Acetivibrio alkalicellulosi]